MFVVKEGKATTVVVKRGVSDDTHVAVTGKDLDGLEVVSGPFRAINRELENESKVKVENKVERKTGASADKE